MNRLHILPADERFSEFGAHAERDGSDYIAGGYQCPDGPPGVSFRWRDIADRKEWGASLTADEREELDVPTGAALGGRPPKADARVAMDFRCPRCDRAVVVIFRSVD